MSSELEKLTERMNRVEIALTHLQMDYEAINETVLLYGKRFEKLEATIQKLTARLENTQSGSEERKPEDEKPPHY